MLDTIYSNVNHRIATLSRKGAAEWSDPVVSWLIFASVNFFAFMLLWFYGLAQQAIASDPTHITLFIVAIYLATSVHCLWRCVAVSRQAAAERRLAAAITGAVDKRRRIMEVAAGLATGRGGSDGSHIADHIGNLITTAKSGGDTRKLDQSLLLRVLAERLSGSTSFGDFAGDLVMKLGLFGTIVGFIMMLAPIAGLNTEDQGAIKSSLSVMSEGMAVAMYTTLAGLVGSILIRIEYRIVEAATDKIFADAVALTEVHVIPVLEQAGTVQ